MMPRWLEIAFSELGVTETSGTESTIRINEYLKSVNLPGNDEIPWCSAFVNWVMQRAGFRGTCSGMARSWVNWGRPVPPCLGGIIIFMRGTPDLQMGHVGFLLDWYNDKYIVLGGNQKNRVGISVYGQNLIGIRMPETNIL